MQWHTLSYVLLLCLARVDAQCSAGFYAAAPPNIALGKFVATSSVYGPNDPQLAGTKAVDGSTDVYFPNYWLSDLKGTSPLPL
jgi:hypothetical protein